MAGFAAALGGVGNAVQQYGQQMRGILEQRRDLFASLAQQRAQEEPDRDMRDQWTQAAAGALSGQDFGKILPKLIKAHDTHQASTQALGQLAQQVVGGQPQQAPPPPSTGSGIPGGIQPVAQPPADQPGQFTSLLTRGLTPTPPVAAQPASNPTAEPQGPIQAPAAPAPAPAVLAAPITPVPTAPVEPIGGSAPTDPRAMRAQIIQDAHTAYQMATPAMRPMIEAEMKSKLDALAPFEQFAQKKAQFEEFSNTPEFKALPPAIQTAYRAQAFSLAPVNLPQGALVPNKFQSTADTLDPAVKTQFGIPPDYKGPVTISKNRMDGSILDVVPGNPGIGLITNADGTQSYTLKTPGSSAGVAPGTVTDFKSGGVDAQGHPIFINPFHPNLNFTGTGVNPGFIPSQSTTTTQTPGQLPTTSHVVKTKGGTTGPITAITGGAASPAIRAVTGSSPSPAAVATDPLTAEKYKEWTAGGPAPTGKDLSAVQMYAQANVLPTPNAMSATGQKNLQAIDTVLQQIKDIKDAMEEKKLQNDESRGYYSDYLKYTHAGEATPLQDLWTKMNFEGIRSAAAALAGVNSRALPIINRAFEHVPNPQASLTHLPDTPKLMYGKLKSMEDMLTKGRQDILNDEKKSGVVTNGPTPIVAAPMTPIIGKTYTQSDVDAAVKSHPGMTTDQIDKAFKDKGYIKK